MPSTTRGPFSASGPLTCFTRRRQYANTPLSSDARVFAYWRLRVKQVSGPEAASRLPVLRDPPRELRTDAAHEAEVLLARFQHAFDGPEVGEKEALLGRAQAGNSVERALAKLLAARGALVLEAEAVRLVAHAHEREEG